MGICRIAAVLAATASVTALSPLHPPAQADPVTTTAVILKVVDGDTVDIRDDVRGRLRIRLLGIDTPETKKPGYTVGCWGPQATQFANTHLAGQRVALIYDPTQGIHDRYGRTLGYLDKADGWDYSVEAARAGWRTATSTMTNPHSGSRRLRPPNRKPKRLGGDCGGRRATATPPRYRPE